MTKKGWRIMPAIITTAILGFSGILIETSMNVTFPLLMKEFGVNPAVIQWVTTGNLLAVAVTVPLSAFMIKNLSERQIFTLANVLFLSGVLIDSFAPNLAILLVGRVLQGVGTGLALPLLFHIILTQIPMERRGLMMGVAAMVTLLAPAVGPTYGGVISGMLGWKMIFMLLAPILIISTFIGLASIPKRQVRINDKLNFPAFVSLGIGLATLLLAIEKMSIFYYLNKQLEFLNLNVFKDKDFSILLYGVLAFQMIPLALSFLLPNLLQLVLHQTSTKAGLFMFPGAIAVVFLSPFAGYLLDKIGAFKPIMIGISLSLIGLIGTAIFIPAKFVVVLLAFDILTKIGMGIGASNMVTTALTKLKPAQSADGNSILNTLQQFAGAFATAVASQIFTIGQVAIPKNGAIIGSQFAVLFVIIVVILAIVGLTYLRKRKAI
ncbi:multidrug MFS transporter [Streptococcus agalactiae GB00901]|uniref:MFS transporter n=1 Tax=Streptococcus agalactiae TaxID=1311 RepID=UPI0002BBBA5A|nr:MFS transporter [Streptococcus agalactiae]EPV45767.1 multidrug MFS transporter [Streptococcus agalactiae GB00901]